MRITFNFNKRVNKERSTTNDISESTGVSTHERSQWSSFVPPREEDEGRISYFYREPHIFSYPNERHGNIVICIGDGGKN